MAWVSPKVIRILDSLGEKSLIEKIPNMSQEEAEAAIDEAFGKSGKEHVKTTNGDRKFGKKTNKNTFIDDEDGTEKPLNDRGELVDEEFDGDEPDYDFDSEEFKQGETEAKIKNLGSNEFEEKDSDDENEYKVGDKVKVQGKEYIITKIDEDGHFEAKDENGISGSGNLKDKTGFTGLPISIEKINKEKQQSNKPSIDYDEIERRKQNEEQKDELGFYPNKKLDEKTANKLRKIGKNITYNTGESEESSPMNEFSGPEGNELSYAQLESLYGKDFENKSKKFNEEDWHYNPESDTYSREPQPRKGLVKDTLVDKFDDAHLYNDGGKFQLALGDGSTKEFDTKDKALDYLSEYSKKDYSWAKDKKLSKYDADEEDKAAYKKYWNAKGKNDNEINLDKWNEIIKQSNPVRKDFKPGDKVINNSYGSDNEVKIIKKLSSDEKWNRSYAANPFAGDYYEVEYELFGQPQREIVWAGRLNEKGK